MKFEDFAPYIPTLLTFLIGAVTIIMTRINLKSSQKLQETLNAKRINADIITKSRIAWIQDVRGQAAETLECYIKYIEAHRSSEKNKAFVSYYNYLKQLDILRLYFPKENPQVTYEFELESLRKTWEKENDFTKLPDDSLSKKYIYQMMYPGSKGNIGRNNYINDYAMQLKSIELPFDTFESAQEKNISAKEFARNLVANQYYLNLLIEVIGDYLKLEWEVAKNFEPIRKNH
ncbi:hypothetical protein [Lactococcus lactis]|uniref:hypothetical protein n=1 Tax=Lactococcus lactis TaxID=1358 RepID=UPI00288CA699|nr:hypothetical protein [Lactococcus lactis]MDT2885579.1 hypothetical protein [Lactococcus lactis]MDT2904791.1 hypothetical protein [Lactococcus lactis]MDT2910566.1 hypothetical protein [Lactococcus lactis]MDT2929325.1 hypothetical protein [Lactococcus lactis]MDT2931689.1 hypothetical protein [Lactococcus lactis]